MSNDKRRAEIEMGTNQEEYNEEDSDHYNARHVLLPLPGSLDRSDEVKEMSREVASIETRAGPSDFPLAHGKGANGKTSMNTNYSSKPGELPNPKYK